VSIAGGVVPLPDDRGLVTARFQVPVNTVVTGVEYAVFKPTDVQVRAIEGDVLDSGGELEPVQAPGCFGPESFIVFDRFRVNAFVSRPVKVRTVFE